MNCHPAYEHFQESKESRGVTSTGGIYLGQGHVFGSVCLSVCRQDYGKTPGQIFMKHVARVKDEPERLFMFLFYCLVLYFSAPMCLSGAL